jgi:hypothetical protein
MTQIYDSGRGSYSFPQWQAERPDLPFAKPLAGSTIRAIQSGRRKVPDAMASEADVYRRLQQHLDRMPVGFPATRSGVEIRILRQLFSPEAAEIALE